jgi:DNA-binding NarL/FixJ family response regulator
MGEFQRKVHHVGKAWADGMVAPALLECGRRGHFFYGTPSSEFTERAGRRNVLFSLGDSLPEEMMQKITVLLAEDHQVVREGLRALLQTQQDIQIVAEARNGRQAVELARRFSPAVVVMDISMPELTGLDATRQIKRATPDTKVLALSSYDDLECVDAMLDAGITGFLTKCSASNQLPEAIRAVRLGKPFFSPEVARRMQDRKNASLRSGRRGGNPFELTPREEEVLQLVAEGLPNKGIASQLGISIKTVEKHRQAVMNRLNIHEVASLTRYALKKGMVAEKVPIQMSVAGSRERGSS